MPSINNFDKSYLKVVAEFEERSIPEISGELKSQYNETHKNTEAIRNRFFKTVSLEEFDLSTADQETKRKIYRYLVHTAEDLALMEKINSTLDKTKITDVSSQLESSVDLIFNALGTDSDNSKFIINEMKSCPKLRDRVVDKLLLGNAIVLAENFEKFDIKSEEKRIEIATIIAESDEYAASALAYNFEKFDIKSEEKRIEFATIIAESGINSATALAKNFEKFDIKSEEKRIEIATIIAKYKFYANTALVKNFEKFDIKSEEKRIEIAEMIIESGAAHALATYFEKFDIKSEEKRIEIAIIIAESDEYDAASALAKNFEKFDIKSEEKRIEIAIIIAESGAAHALATYFEKFDIKSEEKRIEIAIIIAKSKKDTAFDALLNLVGFDISDDAKLDLTNLIKKQTKKVKVSSYLKSAIRKRKKFETEEEKIILYFLYLASTSGDPEERMRPEILERALSGLDSATRINTLKEDVREISDQIKNSEAEKLKMQNLLKKKGIPQKQWKKNKEFKIHQSNVLSLKRERNAKEGLIKAFENAENDLHTLKIFFEPSSSKRPEFKEVELVCKRLVKVINAQEDLKDKKGLINHVKEMRERGEILQSIFFCLDNLGKEDSPVHKELLLWSLETFWKADQVPEIYRDPTSAKVLKNIFNLRGPELRKKYRKLYYDITKGYPSTEEKMKFLEDIGSPPHMSIVKLALRDLQDEKGEIDDALIKKIAKKKRFLEDGEKLRVFLGEIDSLKNSSLSNDKIKMMLNYFFGLSDKDLFNELKCLSGIFSLGTEVDINIEEGKKGQILNSLFDSFDKLDTGIAIKDREKFIKTFFGARSPGAIAIYVSRILTLAADDKESVLNELSSFVSQIDNETFHSERYEDSEHLNKIFVGRDELKRKWKEGASGLLKDYVKAEDESKTPFVRAKEMIQQSAAHGHLPMAQLPGLAEKCGIEIKPGKTKPLKELDSLVVNLLESPENLNGAALDKVATEVKKADPHSEFLNDIKELKKILAPKKKDEDKEWTIVDSDDPLDLFLSGTEVGGSCQRVNGDAKLNKALMGYVMDGKHRILTIKKENGEIAGRLILRLLAGTTESGEEEPVLFFERIYPESLQPTYREALKQFAIKRSDDLGLKLISKETKTDKKYDRVAKSLGSKAPFEYCDGAGGIQSGPYQIADCYLIKEEPMF